jgi:hypothetical protein
MLLLPWQYGRGLADVWVHGNFIATSGWGNAMDSLAELYLGMGVDEPAPEHVTLAERFLNGVIERPPVAAGALDDLERTLRDATPEFADLGADEIRVVAAAATRHMATLANCDGLWLTPFARVPFCHLATGARLAELGHEYTRSAERQGPARRMVDGLLRELGQPSGTTGSKAYLRSLRLDESAYLLPNILLALANSPHRYAPETLAAVEPTLTGALFEMPAWIADCLKAFAHDTGIELPERTGKRPEDVPLRVAEALREFVEAGLAADGRSRFDAFSHLLRAALRLHRAELERACLNALRAPERCMADLVARKTPAARRAHGPATLDGTPLDVYFDRFPKDNQTLLAALAASRWVKAGHPDQSPFLTALTPIHAPMGKIFSAEDLSIIRRWITWLAAPDDISPIPAAAVAVGELDRCPDEPEDQVTFGAHDTRVLFHELVAGHDRGRVIRRARAFVDYWLDAAQELERPVFTWELPDRYVADEFPDWMHQTYQVMASAPVSPATDNGKAHRDRTFHGAADNLVDGAWLQGLTRRVQMSDSERLLYDIYWDEIGNGQPGRSHGVLYEDLLVGLGCRLPKFWTKEFVEDVDFLDEGFVAPTFRLAISEFPVSRYPEIVGVNMVCEFHGLGTAGISKADDLTKLGYDTGFTRLHIADDNVEMGHSAKSRDAVVFLMVEAARLGVTELVWERVRRGATAMRLAYVVLMQGRLGIAPTQVPAHLTTTSGR